MRIEFCLASLIKKPFEFFWFTQTSFYVHQKNSKGFLIRDAKQSLLRNETQFSQCTAKPSRFTVQNKRKPLKTHCAQSCAFLSLMQTRSFFIFSRKSIILSLINFYQIYENLSGVITGKEMTFTTMLCNFLKSLIFQGSN